jgi:transcriptional antiterminator NusG
MSMVEQRLWKKGEFIELVDLTQFGLLEVPMMPQRWFVLRTHPAREFKVMKTFSERNISAYLPRIIRTIARDTRKVARKPHLGRTIVEPLFHGLIFIPDFQVKQGGVLSVDGVIDYFRMADCTPYLQTHEIAQVRALEQLSTIPLAERKRLYKVGQLIRFVDGPFVGFEGLIERLDSRGRLRVFLDAIKRGVSVITTEAQIEPALASTDALNGSSAAS